MVTNVHGNLMDEMMVTIIQGHAQRLGIKTIAGPCHQSIMMNTLSGIGVDFIDKVNADARQRIHHDRLMAWPGNGFYAQTLGMALNDGHHHLVHQIAVDVGHHVCIQQQIIPSVDHDEYAVGHRR